MTVNGYCLSWLLPVSDLDGGILGKKLHGIKWGFLNYKACHSRGSEYQLSVSSRSARKKVGGWGGGWTIRDQHFLSGGVGRGAPCSDYRGGRAVDPIRVSPVSKLNGCGLPRCGACAVAPGPNSK